MALNKNILLENRILVQTLNFSLWSFFENILKLFLKKHIMKSGLFFSKSKSQEKILSEKKRIINFIWKQKKSESQWKKFILKKELLQPKPSISIADLSQITPKNQQGWWSWISDHTQPFLNYLNADDWKTWLLVGIGSVVLGAFFLWFFGFFPSFLYAPAPPAPVKSLPLTWNSLNLKNNRQFEDIKGKLEDVRETRISMYRTLEREYNASYWNEMDVHKEEIRSLLTEMSIDTNGVNVPLSAQNKAAIVDQIRIAYASGQMSPEADEAMLFVIDIIKNF